METCETVTIVGQDGNALRINASDFDPAKHEVFKPVENVKTEPTADDEAAKNAGNGQPGNGAPAGQPIPGAAAPRGAAKPS